RSSAISPAHPVSGVGSGLGWPDWLTFLKQPFAVVHAGSPNWERYVPMSFSAFGSSCASTIAIVIPEPPDEGRLYALWRSAGVRPLGDAKTFTVPCGVPRTRAWQRA